MASQDSFVCECAGNFTDEPWRYHARGVDVHVIKHGDLSEEMNKGW